LIEIVNVTLMLDSKKFFYDSLAISFKNFFKNLVFNEIGVSSAAALSFHFTSSGDSAN
jgi:hypothetical protein